MKLVADVHIPYLTGAFEPFFDKVLYLPAEEINSLVVKDADALIVRTRTLCNSGLLDGSKVKFIGSATIGFDHIDVEYCKKNGIHWTNSSGCNADAVLQWVMATLVYLQRNANFDLASKVFGVVGVGNVGGRVANALTSLGLTVMCCDPPRVAKEGLKGYKDFDDITKHADIISFHVPLNISGIHRTYHMGNDEFFNNLKPGSIIINSSRGEVIDSKSMLKAYNNGIIHGLALDVWEDEPHINTDLVRKAHISTPHIAGYSLEGKINGTKMVIEGLSQFFNLGLNSWDPDPNPLNEKAIINDPKQITEVIEKTYDIEKDNTMFKTNPLEFEMLRNKYSYRRDFTGHKIITRNEFLHNILVNLGFQVSNI